MKYFVIFIFLLTNCSENPTENPIPLKPNLFFSKSGKQIHPFPSTIFFEVRGRDLIVEGVKVLSLDSDYKILENELTFNISVPLFYSIRTAMCEARHTPDSKGEFLKQKLRKSFELFRSCNDLNIPNAAFLFPENLPAETVKTIVRTALRAGLINIGILEPKGNHEFFLRNIDEFYFNFNELNEYTHKNRQIRKKRRVPQPKHQEKEVKTQNHTFDNGIRLDSPVKSKKFSSTNEFNHMFSNGMFLYYVSTNRKLKDDLKSTLIQTFIENYKLYDGFLPISDLFTNLSSNQFQTVSAALRILLKKQDEELIYKLRKDIRTLEVLKSFATITQKFYFRPLYDDIKNLLKNIYKNPDVMDHDSRIRLFLANHIKDFNKNRTSKKDIEDILISLLEHGNHTASTGNNFCRGKYCRQDFRVNQTAAKKLGELDFTPEIITSLVSCIFSHENGNLTRKSNYNSCSESILKISKNASAEQKKMLKNYLLLAGTGDPELMPQIFDIKSGKFGTNLKNGYLENLTTVCPENFWVFKHSSIYEEIERSGLKFPADSTSSDAAKTACNVFKIAKENNMLNVSPYIIEANVLILLNKLGFSNEYKILRDYLCNESWNVAFEKIEKSWTSKAHSTYFEIYNLRKSVRLNFCKHADSYFKSTSESYNYPGAALPVDLIITKNNGEKDYSGLIYDRGSIQYTSLDIKGKISPFEINSTFKSHNNEIRHCYQKGLMQDNKLEGLIRVSIQIDPQGVVKTCKVINNLTLESTGNCICSRIFYWRFPNWMNDSARDKELLLINYSAYFRPD